MASISGKVDPVVRPIVVGDVVDAISRGLRDFQAAPKYGLVFGIVYALGGIAIVLSMTALGMAYMAYPLAAGFTLLGPFVAAGLYEVSRRRETGQSLPSFGDIWRTVKARREIAWMAFVVIFIFVTWLYQVRLLMAIFLQSAPTFATFSEFIDVVLTTNEGLLFLAVGNLVGAALSLILFSLTVVSFPLVLDRDVDFVTAMITSVKSVTTSPVPMIGWAAIVVVLLIVSSLPFFVGLIVTLPVLGHTTWHLYRKLVAPEAAGTVRQGHTPQQTVA